MHMDTSDKGEYRLETTMKSLRILEVIGNSDGITLDELIEEIDMAKTTVYRHLHSLREAEYVVKHQNQHFLSMKFLKYPEHCKRREPGYRFAAEKVEELADETGEAVQFFVEEFGYATYVFRSAGEKAAQTNPVPGERVPIHAIAGGKAILAHLPTERIEQIIDKRGLSRLTEHTVTDRRELFDELETIRTRGYSINQQEHIEGLNAIGAPVLLPDDTVLGSISISGPANRLQIETIEDEFVDLLLGIINELELTIQYNQ